MENIKLLIMGPLSLGNSITKASISYLGENSVDFFKLSDYFFESPVLKSQEDANIFQNAITNKLDSYPCDQLRKLIVLFAANLPRISPDDWNPLLWWGDKRELCYPLSSLVARLVLTYPEIYWVFLSDSSGTDALAHRIFPSDYLGRLKKIIRLVTKGYSPLFDPSGLRQCIKKFHLKEIGVRLREDESAAIDEEKSYAYFNAYTAYRFGYRSHIITSLEAMKELLKENESRSINPILECKKKCNITFEDIYLGFPDRELDDDLLLSDIETRDLNFPRLKNIKNRIFLTVGHSKLGQSGGFERRKFSDYRRALRNRNVRSKVIFKPVGGIFDIQKKSNLKEKSLKKEPIYKRHSAPGILLAMSEKLIVRSEILLRGTKNIPDAIHAALLALEAKELLSDMTPTTTLEALSLQHRAEVTAECMFHGIKYNFEVKQRLRTLKKEGKNISQWFKKHKIKKSAELSARATIIGKLTQIFSNFNQFDEENQSLAEMRQLKGLLSFMQKPMLWPLYPIHWYVQFLLRSLSHFILTVIFWIFFFAMFWFLIISNEHLVFGDYLFSSLRTFLTFEAPVFSESLLKSGQKILLFGIPQILGFLHLGTFISHVYTMLQRR